MGNGRVIGLFVSDLHLSLRRPASRADENWLEAQACVMDEVFSLRLAYGLETWVICAGDIFDVWCPPPELINWAIPWFRKWDKVYAIPGQHDLPMHNLQDIQRSGYWTLVEAGVLRDLRYPVFQPIEPMGRISVGAFPWGVEIQPPLNTMRMEGLYNLCVNHRYVSIPGHEYKGAPIKARVSGLRTMLQGYDVAVFGDNHIPFITNVGDCMVVNPGRMIRRKSDEREHPPRIGVMYEDGSVELISLNTSQEVWADRPVEEENQESPGLAQFIRELSCLDTVEYDFRTAVEEYMRNNPVPAGVKRELLEAMEPENKHGH